MTYSLSFKICKKKFTEFLDFFFQIRKNSLKFNICISNAITIAIHAIDCISILERHLRYFYWIITSAEEGGYVFSSVCLSVCLFVCPSDNWKSREQNLTKFLGGVGHGPGTKWLNFDKDPDHRPDPGVRSPKSGFTGLSKKYLVDSDQNCIVNLHCKNHSAIILSCRRSAEVCALWVLL